MLDLLKDGNKNYFYWDNSSCLVIYQLAFASWPLASFLIPYVREYLS